VYFILQNTKLDKLNFKLIIMKNLNVFLFLMLVPLLISCGGSDGGGDVIIEVDKVITTENLIDTHSGEINGQSTLTRYDNLITFKIETDNLIPGHVYQVICAIFNKPENCVGPCDVDDFNNNNPAVEAIAFVMAGKVVNSTSATFEGTLETNETSSYDWLPVGAPANKWGGVQNPFKATIGLLLKSQGPAQDGLTNTQMTTYQNACSFKNYGYYEVGSRVPEEIGECAYIRDSQHVAP